MSQSNIQSISADGRGISRQWNETLEEASGVIAKYAVNGDETNLVMAVTVSELVAKKLEAKGGDADMWEDAIKGVLKARATDESTIHPLVKKPTKYDPAKKWVVPQGVALDLGTEGEMSGRTFGLDVPYIHFCKIEETDSIWEEGAQEFMAVVFDPAQASDEDLTRTMMWDGSPVIIKSDWDPTGYVGVARFFASYKHMKDERKALIRALRDIHAPTPSDEEDDTFSDNSWVDEDDDSRMYDEDTSL